MVNRPSMLPGHRYRLRRSADPNGAPPYVFLCIVRSKTLTFNTSYTEALLPDCDDADAIPVRSSTKSGSSWGATFSGTADPSRIDFLRTDIRQEEPTWYQFELDPQDGVGAGVWQGRIHFESLEIASADFGEVTFSVTARGDEDPTWIPAS